MKTSGKLLAHLSARQVDAVIRSDDAAEEVDRAIRQLWSKLIRSLGPHPNALQIRVAVAEFFRRLTPLAISQTGEALVRSAKWGHKTAADAMAKAIPAKTLGAAAVQKVRESANMFCSSGEHNLLEDFAHNQPGVIALSVDPSTGEIKARDRAGRLREPVRDRFSPERQRQIFKDLLFPPPDLRQIQDIVFSRFEGATFADRLARAASFGDADQIAFNVAQSFSQGRTIGQIAKDITPEFARGNIRQVAKDLLPLVNKVRAAARRIARTDSMRVINRTSWEAQNNLGDLVIGWTLSAQLDQNSRPWHAARNGRQYFKNPGPGQDGLSKMPHPPDEPEDISERPSGAPKIAWNCRCVLLPIVGSPPKVGADDPTVFRQASGLLIPEPGAYSDWWRQADDRRRKIAVGAKRYATLLDRLQREPDWIEFMDPDTGGLLTMQQIRDETPSERVARVQKMQRLIGDRRRELERVTVGV